MSDPTGTDTETLAEAEPDISGWDPPENRALKCDRCGQPKDIHAGPNQGVHAFFTEGGNDA